MKLIELSWTLRDKQEHWWKAISAGEYVQAAYLANDIEALVRDLMKQTYNLVENKYADPQSAIGLNPGPSQPPASGDGR